MTFWNNKKNWITSAHNTKWCLVGCAIGDIGTISYFQSIDHDWSAMQVMALAMFNGLTTSVILETFILMRGGFNALSAFKTAMGMSFISMIAMELAMNVTDIFLTGGAVITFTALPMMLLAGFLVPWPYNYWRLEKLGKGCCRSSLPD